MRGEIIEFFIIKQITKPRLVLCSVVKHLGSGRALKKWGKTLDCVSCFPLHFFRALPLPACFKAAKYEIQKPPSRRATLFRCKFSSMFPVFHLAWSTLPTTKTFVACSRNAVRWLVDLLGHEQICCATSCEFNWWKTSNKSKICCSK